MCVYFVYALRMRAPPLFSNARFMSESVGLPSRRDETRAARKPRLRRRPQETRPGHRSHDNGQKQGQGSKSHDNRQKQGPGSEATTTGRSKAWACFVNGLAMFWACFGNVLPKLLGMFWQCFGSVLGMFWQCSGNALGMF